VTLGPVRQILRGCRTPLAFRFRDGSIVVASSQRIRSTDGGRTWRPIPFPQVHLNTLELSDGRTRMLEYDPKPIPGEPGVYRVTQWESRDRGTTVAGPFSEGRLRLPPERFPPGGVRWFHGNTIETEDGELLSVMQDRSGEGGRFEGWRTFLVKSVDGGVNWDYVSDVASSETIEDPDNLLQTSGWELYYAAEPFLLDLGEGRLLCVMRTVNDEAGGMSLDRIGPPLEEYHDLFHAVSGKGIRPSLMDLPEDRYFEPGPPSSPLVASRSVDGGATWSPARPMPGPRGCFPRLAESDGVLALTYGGLSGVPRWGNAISFSLDEGETWTEEVVFGPFLTTGYTGVLATGPGRFLCLFDCTPPQPWTNEAAWWIGAVDVTVERN